MALMSKQHLKRAPVERERTHEPVEAELEVGHSDKEWSKANGVVCNLYAYLGKQYQVLYLTNGDLVQILPEMINSVEKRADLADIAVTALRRLDDGSLLNVLQQTLKNRVPSLS